LCWWLISPASLRTTVWIRATTATAAAAAITAKTKHPALVIIII
jgi:hypothetical protein